jgi:hypothetical protein
MRCLLIFNWNRKRDLSRPLRCIGFLVEIQLQISTQFVPGDRLFSVVVDFMEQMFDLFVDLNERCRTNRQRDTSTGVTTTTTRRRVN